MLASLLQQLVPTLGVAKRVTPISLTLLTNLVADRSAIAMLSKTIDLEAADHLVKSVTIFQSSKAEVTRTFKVNLQVS